MRRLERTISALVYTLIRESTPDSPAPAVFPNNRAVRFVLDQQARMPDYLRLGIRLGTWLFAMEAWLVSCRPFHGLPPAKRAHRVASWRRSRFGVKRDLIRFYESLAVFAWYTTFAEETDGSADAAS